MNKLIVTVNMNPCVDKTMEFEKIVPGGLNRAVSSRNDFGGKGINVARVLNAIGRDTLCTGFNYTDGGDGLERALDADGIAHDFITADGRLRMNVKIYDKSAAIMTELNERGGFIPPEKTEQLIKKLSGCADGAAMFVLSGSVPDGVPTDIYKRIIQTLPKNKIILDADGPLFKEALAAGPYAVKPNLYELETALGVKLKTHSEIAGACEKIINEGSAKIVLVSMGPDGAMISDGEKNFYSPAPDVVVKGLQGAGDSMAAGMCAAIYENKTLDEILRYSVAAAAGSIQREGTLLCTREGFADALDIVKIYREV